MSRCFPYPPPSCERRRARGEPLIESIEIQREREAETGKRKVRRERREKRHQHKKTKDKKTDYFSWNSKKLDEVQLQNENESERSALTEEHSQPVLVDSLSDGSDSGSKRKRASPLSNAFERNGKKLRISFTLKKQPVLDLSINEQQVCSTSGREVEWSNVLPSNASNQMGNDLHRIGSTSENKLPKIGSSSEEKLPKALLSGSKKTKRIASQYKMLVEDWVPPPISQVYDGEDGDLDWLLPRKDETCKRKAFEANVGVSYNGGTNIFPRACYLAEADMFAMPFVTQF